MLNFLNARLGEELEDGWTPGDVQKSGVQSEERVSSLATGTSFRLCPVIVITIIRESETRDAPCAREGSRPRDPFNESSRNFQLRNPRQRS
jgi:hypothetical protein